jgi:hypothetical protein
MKGLKEHQPAGDGEDRKKSGDGVKLTLGKTLSFRALFIARCAYHDERLLQGVATSNRAILAREQQPQIVRLSEKVFGFPAEAAAYGQR